MKAGSWDSQGTPNHLATDDLLPAIAFLGRRRRRSLIESLGCMSVPNLRHLETSQEHLDVPILSIMRFDLASKTTRQGKILFFLKNFVD